MRIKSANKKMQLSFLIKLTENNYINIENGQEYCQESVNDIILIKQSISDKKMIDKHYKDLEYYENYLSKNIAS